MNPHAAAATASLPGLPLRHHLAVVLDTERIGAEDERVLAVVERVEQDANRVGVVEVGVAAALADENVLWLRVEADDADIEVLPVEQKPDLGPLGGRLPFVRLLLDECRERFTLCPHVLVHQTIDDGSLPLGRSADVHERRERGLRACRAGEEHRECERQA